MHLNYHELRIQFRKPKRMPIEWLGILTILGLYLILFCGCVCAEPIPMNKAVNAIIGEAEGESAGGKLAIACALRNRGTLKGVYGEYSPRVMWNQYPPYIHQQAAEAWLISADPSMCADMLGSNEWRGENDAPSDCTPTVNIGKQRFYRCEINHAK